jgi:hypothetical protein
MSPRHWATTLLLCGATAVTTHVLDRAAKEDRIPDPWSSRNAVDVAVGTWVQPANPQWMLSPLRLSKGDAVQATRTALSPDAVRVVVADPDGFSGDIITMDLDKGSDEKIHAIVRVDWIGDMGPPFDGSYEGITGTIHVNSADLVGAHPLVVDYALSGRATANAICEHGSVTLP